MHMRNLQDDRQKHLHRVSYIADNVLRVYDFHHRLLCNHLCLLIHLSVYVLVYFFYLIFYRASAQQY